MNKMLSLRRSRIKNRNGWSALNTGYIFFMTTAVAAAASVPVSFTETHASWCFKFKNH